MAHLKLYDVQVTFAEIPGEICLCIYFSGCPIQCPECNSKWLWKDVGVVLKMPQLRNIIDAHPNVTCIVFMGGDQDPKGVNRFIRYVYFHYKQKYKIAWYRGGTKLENLDCLNFIKTGPYNSKYGPLNEITTNQRLYEIEHDDVNIIKDITYRMWPVNVRTNETQNLFQEDLSGDLPED